MSDLAALIARLESATEGSREFDRDIALAHGWRRMWSEDRAHGGWYWRGGPSDCARTAEDDEHPPLYTRSLDAALTLVKCPEGYGPMWTWQIQARLSDRIGHHTFEAEITVPSREWRGFQRSPAIALVIAALKARFP